MPTVTGIKETCLYCADLEVTRTFYTNVLKLPVMAGDPSRFCSLDVGGASVLLLFQKGSTLEPAQSPEGVIPPHDGAGPVHIGFSISVDDYEPWKAELRRCSIPIVSETVWKRGGCSLYFHDPDGHLVELITPGIWPTY